MLFNSLEFALFLPIVLILYWFVFPKSISKQNLLILLASYIFYAWWDWRFLFLLFFSTFLDYFSGLKIEQSKTNAHSKFWLVLSIGINLGFLGFFKYYNFFVTELTNAIANAGIVINPWTLKVILPVGISFYTFHGLSYIIDVYKKRIIAERNFVDYAVFVSYFPLLVAGPIERATHLLPQFKKARAFDYDKAADGLRQILWGLFKKIVIADNCATYANTIFNASGEHNGSSLFIGALFFTFQIYGDFSGYSDIALGVSRLFGIELLRNFAFPYFSRDIAEFWRRWHISLSTWFRDYLYFPLGGSQGGTWMKIRNTFIIFLVSGFWHGANWTFMAWGLLNALYFIPLLLLNKNRNYLEVIPTHNYFPSLKEFFQISLTFFLTVIAWIFFRSDTISQAFAILNKIFSKSLFQTPNFLGKNDMIYFIIHCLMVGLLIITEWMHRDKQFGLQFNQATMRNTVKRWSIYAVIVVFILLFGGKQNNFIYFQF
ncbi:MBOAT family O-acyltransferase [Flavobacterium sp.]|uniref:MBOAT family O-acyltransferase n=1 Tax=Flavobacterium sp. TaxID=239 RepID=UPI0026001CFD|nr:MBOAT family O-acyltransferase [Flavobacterium sp.]